MDPLDSLRSLDPAKRASSLFDEFKAFAFKLHFPRTVSLMRPAA